MSALSRPLTDASRTLRRLLRWLYPGIGVKRWAALAVLGALLAAVGLLAWTGQDLVRAVYRWLSPGPSRYPIAVGLVAVGLGLTVLGINRTVHALVRGVAPESAGRASEVLYARTRLGRGPRIVALGGGTGLSTLLRGLKAWTANLSAVVTVMDDGGSSGRLREEMRMLPPGDIRNCLIALAEDESEIAALFQHRFHNPRSALDGHALGNLILAGLQQRTGRFDTAVERMSRLLKVRGQVLPATLEDVQLVAEMEDGAEVVGEVNIAHDPRRIRTLRLSRPDVPAYERALRALAEAQVIVLGPGSLFTSILPNLLVTGLVEALQASPALKVYVANLMTQPGETDGFTLSDHLRVLGTYLNLDVLDHVIAHDAPLPSALAARYRREGAAPVVLDEIRSLTRARLVRADLAQVVELEGKLTLKHDPTRLAQTIMTCAQRAGLRGTRRPLRPLR